MAMCKLPYTVKYEGRFYAPHESVEVKSEDMEELLALGAKVISQTPQDAKSPSKPIDKKPEKKTPYKIPPAKKGNA